MGRLIVTETKVAKNPFRMKETGHPLYSYEELCYYIMSRMPLWLLETDRKGLTAWVRERGVFLPDTDEMEPLEAAEQILKAGTYLRKDERQQVIEEMKSYSSLAVSVREKEKGDLYLCYGKLLKAFTSYEKAIQNMGEQEDSWKACLYHNMGVILCRFFYWEEAEEWLLKALDLSERKETQMALDFVKDMKQMQWKQGEEPLLTIELERKKKEFLEEL